MAYESKKPSIRRRVYAKAKGQILTNPRKLLKPSRIDIAAKTIFARAYLESNTSFWPEHVYKEHIRAFNNFYENYPLKSNFSDFKDSFIRTIESVRSKDNWKHKAPVLIDSDDYLINGAHRTAASIVSNDALNSVIPNKKYKDIYNYEFFKAGHADIPPISEDVLDYMTIEYVSLKKSDIFVAIIFPTAEGKRQEVYNHLKNLGEIVNVKNFPHDMFVGKEIIKQVYFDSNNDQWNYGNDFSGAEYKASFCFDGVDDLQVYVIEANLDESSRIKEKQYLRDLWGKDKHSIHITDTIEEANRIVRMFFNENSRNLLKIDRKNEFFSQKMYDLFNQYIALAPKDITKRDNIAIEGSALLDLLNIRKAKDIDYISRDKKINFSTKDIEKHDEIENKYHTENIDEILTNPKYFLYYKGYKFICLQELFDYKKNRYKQTRDEKDKNDIDKIGKFIATRKYSEEKVLDDKKVSIIVPVYNTPVELMKKSFDSIQNQSYKNTEIIIVDDGSKKDIAKWIDGYISKIDNAIRDKWRVIHQKNHGLAAARNRGYESSTGEYIHFLDADDYFEKKLIEASMRIALETNADIIVENFKFKDYRSGFTSIAIDDNAIPDKEVFSLNDIESMKFESIPYNVWSKLFKRDFLEENRIEHDEELYRSEDVLFTLHSLLKAKRIAYNNQSNIIYLDNLPSSNSNTNDKYPKESIKAWTKVYELLENTPDVSIYEEDFRNAATNSLRWHFERLNTEAAKNIFAVNAIPFIENMGFKGGDDFIIELYLRKNAPSAVRHYLEQKSLLIATQARLSDLESHLVDVDEALHHYQYPGVKFAARKFAGSVKRKSKKIIKYRK